MLVAPWVAYLGAAILAELALPFFPVATGLIDAAVLLTSLSHFGWAQRSPIAIGDADVRLLPVVALVPVLRILSLTMPLPEEAPAFWLALVGVPLLLAVLATARLAHFDVDQIALTRFPRDATSAVVVLASVPLGLALASLTPRLIDAPSGSVIAAVLVGASLVGAGAIPEELIFRGLLQPLLGVIIGRMSVLISALVFAVTYAGSRSLAVIGLMAAIGLVYGWEADRSRSLWPAMLGHGLLLLSAVFLAPLLGITWSAGRS